ncbi:hypothetical protein [Roseburia sp. AF20-18LB]|uniref:hypothetical protein n=1 Tax=Roseburia sp. AF20-18LB TaxID=2293129 RepID=UPI0011C14347|nr:hypothetical protein [Roseburia sp. AF20-18LB]
MGQRMLRIPKIRDTKEIRIPIIKRGCRVSIPNISPEIPESIKPSIIKMSMIYLQRFGFLIKTLL